MAKKVVTTTEFTDDMDGGTATGTVAFAFDGTSYEIDLSKKNKTAMEKAKDNGFTVSERGRISQDTIDAYTAAH